MCEACHMQSYIIRIILFVSFAMFSQSLSERLSQMIMSKYGWSISFLDILNEKMCQFCLKFGDAFRVTY